MNLVLLFEDDFIGEKHVRLSDRRFEHVSKVHQAKKNDILNVGLLNGNMGRGFVDLIDKHSLTMTVELNQPPPPALPLTLVLALPRPKMLKRILQTCAAMGVKDIILINSYRVEKSFWQTPILTPVNINEQLILGLEQAKDTLLPQVRLEKRFKPFVEDHLPTLCEDTLALVAHPGSTNPCPNHISDKSVLAIGPEGGFIPFEIDALLKIGFQAVHLGDRILRVENAVPVTLAKLFD